MNDGIEVLCDHIVKGCIVHFIFMIDGTKVAADFGSEGCLFIQLRNL